ncbi:MAG TPA: CIA30 family protein [Opitutaceae bacterium]|nr:CIA30 family protein [Opitutaceae bacterium]
MKSFNTSLHRRLPWLAFCILTGPLLLPLTMGGAGAPTLIDDFSNAEQTTAGAARPIITDKDIGGQSQATANCADGIFAVTGTLAPGRGMPAFVSVPLLLSTDAQPQDVSGREGVRLRVKIERGALSVQVSSTEIDNFDYHTSAPIVRKPGAFQEIRIPFSAMKRAWSEQVPLNLKTITSVNLVVAGMAPGAFAYEVDEIGFY